MKQVCNKTHPAFAFKLPILCNVNQQLAAGLTFIRVDVVRQRDGCVQMLEGRGALG